MAPKRKAAPVVGARLLGNICSSGEAEHFSDTTEIDCLQELRDAAVECANACLKRHRNLRELALTIERRIDAETRLHETIGASHEL